jgi:hypothetical protein
MRMKKQSIVTIDKKKVLLVNILYLAAMIIIFLGMFFTIFSLVNHISFEILNSSIPGWLFGLLVLYLGLRYYFSVIKLKGEVFKASSKFSWSNFKGKKSKKFVLKR